MVAITIKVNFFVFESLSSFAPIPFMLILRHYTLNNIVQLFYRDYGWLFQLLILMLDILLTC